MPPFATRSPVSSSLIARRPPTRESLSVEGGFLEAWAQGYNVGSLIILILIVACNYRPGTSLHKLILTELALALWHGTFIFVHDPAYGWYLSATAALLFVSYFLHNIVAWLKIRPFLPSWGSRFFLISLLCVQPFWVAEAWSNFSYFNSLGSNINVNIRPWEAMARDPWWIFTTCKLVHAINKTYGLTVSSLVALNPRFGVMLLCMALSLVFLLIDAAISAAKASTSSGINPYWRFALVFKCASDTIFLDDFKSVLDSIVARRFSSTHSPVPSNVDNISIASPQPPGPEPPSFRSRHRRFFPKRRKSFQVPTVRVQHDTTIAAEPRDQSVNSSASEALILPRPVCSASFGNTNDPDANPGSTFLMTRLDG